MNDRMGGTFNSDRSSGGLNAVDIAVKPAEEAKAIEIEFADASGSNRTVLLGRARAADLVVHLVDALLPEEGRDGPSNRVREAQLLLRALIGAHGRKGALDRRTFGSGRQHHIAVEDWQGYSNRCKTRSTAGASEVDCAAGLKPADLSQYDPNMDR
jgi:hypothetical protein